MACNTMLILLLLLLLSLLLLLLLLLRHVLGYTPYQQSVLK